MRLGTRCWLGPAGSDQAPLGRERQARREARPDQYSTPTWNCEENAKSIQASRSSSSSGGSSSKQQQQFAVGRPPAVRP